MRLDSYETPDAETLLRCAQHRHSGTQENRRLLITEAVAAAAFLTSAVLLAAQRVRFPLGSAWTSPTQLAFVSMLFVLPTELVPLVVAVCSAADLLPQALRRRLPLTRLLARVADGFYSLGPALVLVLFAENRTLLSDAWPVLLLALGAQILFDAGAGLSHTWFAERIPPSRQLPMLWLYLTDVCLSCVGLAIAVAAIWRPENVFLSLPLIGLLWLFAREREQRLERTLALSATYRGVALLLGDLLEADDQYTGIHSREVVELSLAISDQLGLDVAQRQSIEFTARLHDVGKIRVPKEIINKPGKLDQSSELSLVRQHTIEGEQMLRVVGGELATVGQYVRSTHEHFDGYGYPDGIAREEIPIESRVVAVCDAFNAMTTDRPYRKAMASETALDELRRCAGTQFDPEVVSALERSLGMTAKVGSGTSES
jgi:HD-GYP domain-containing protein (c-di-GMP phosphodiesterase class II)